MAATALHAHAQFLRERPRAGRQQRTRWLQCMQILIGKRMVDEIPDPVRRFVLTSIPTVPHLEALLLLWRDPHRQWPVHEIAARLYVPDTTATPLVEELCQAGLIACAGDPPLYRSVREPPELVALLHALDATYSRRLREVTALIHSNIDRKAARFAQAFAWRKG